MKIARYELKVVYKKELILMMEDDVDSEDLLKIFLETQLKEEKEQSELLGIIAEKVSEESCTEQCESCQKYCPASEECMATDENVRCTKCEYLTGKDTTGQIRIIGICEWCRTGYVKNTSYRLSGSRNREKENIMLSGRQNSKESRVIIAW